MSYDEQKHKLDVFLSMGLESPDMSGMEISNELAGKRVGGDPENEADHFMECRGCGQNFDMRDLGQIIHHEQAGHKPISLGRLTIR